jgi:hypothetical protein
MPAKLTTSEFISNARAIHGDRYDYDRTVYVNNRTNITITCREHGDFEQRPTNHISQPSGCPYCGRSATTAAKTSTIRNFVEKARKVHGSRYDYSKGVYVNNSTKLIITCPEHGDFEQTPGNHIMGKGCPSCGGKTILNTETFIENARRVHGDKYDYRRSKYVTARRNVVITCPEHGDFEQTPNRHISQGSGCPSCAAGGYDPHKTGYLYFLLDTETHSRIKIGISNRPKQRLRELRSRTPFTFEPMEIIKTYGEIAPQLEKLCHEALPSAGLTGFCGATEWLKYEGDKVRQLIETCESYRLLDTPLHMR